MKRNPKAVGFCTICSHEVESFEGLNACPKCGATGIPCDYSRQANVNINVHELHILCIWAENWAQSREDVDENTVYAIAARLKQQLGPQTTLTMHDELKALQDAGYEFQTNHPVADDPQFPRGTYRDDDFDHPNPEYPFDGPDHSE